MRTAVVVGAGVGGLAAAGALARSGWRVTLLERADRLHGSGAAMLIWPNGQAALRALGLSLDDIAVPVTAGGIRRPDGRWLVDAASTPSSAVIVHSDDLHDALMAGLGDQVEIRTGMDVTGVNAGSADRPSVSTAKYTFGADLIVAADGGRSVIRRRLAAQSAIVPAGYTAWRAVIPWFRAPKLPEGLLPTGELLGAGQRFAYVSLGDRGAAGGSSRGGIYWVATALGGARPEPPATQLTLLRRWFAEWSAPVAQLLAITEAEDLVQQPGEALRPLPRRFDVPVGAGGFVLLGDAAHVATSHLAQGACLAFEDAATLRAAVRDAGEAGTLTVAMDGYTRARRARVASVAKASHRLGLLLQAQGRLRVRTRDAALSRFSPRLLDRAAAAAAQWAPPA